MREAASRVLSSLYRKAVPQAARDQFFLFRHRLRWVLAGKRRRAAQRHALPAELIVSVTSYRPRFGTLALTLRTLLTQSLRPDRVVLWIEEHDEAFLPRDVLALQSHGLSIERCEPGIRSYNKIIPCLRQWPGSFIITVDDDIAYPASCVAELVGAYRGNDRETLFRRGHRITLDDRQMPRGYNDWDWEHASETSDTLNFPTGVGGVLYPPGALHADAVRSDIFRQHCPTADDVWLYFMGARNGCTFRKIGHTATAPVWPGSQSVALAADNFQSESGNDAQVASLVGLYGFPPR